MRLSAAKCDYVASRQIKEYCAECVPRKSLARCGSLERTKAINANPSAHRITKGPPQGDLDK